MLQIDGDKVYFVRASIQWAGAAPGMAGVYQINAEVPTGLPAGVYWLSVNQAYPWTDLTRRPGPPYSVRLYIR